MVQCLVNNKSVSTRKDAVITALEVICLQELRNTAQNSQYIRFSGRDLNPGPPEYQARVIRTRAPIQMRRIKKRKIQEGTTEINKDENLEKW
jgi:hypothetical protein